MEDYASDIIVKHKTCMEHNTTLQRVPQWCHENNLKLNSLKCSFNQFLEFLVQSQGIQIDPTKTQVITEMWEQFIWTEKCKWSFGQRSVNSLLPVLKKIFCDLQLTLHPL